MKYIVKINNKSYEVEVEKGEASVVGTTTEVAAGNVPLAAPVAASVAVPAATAVTPANGERVTAPMPGTVVSIKVNTGDRVKRGDVLLTLEAMKMENEIVAPIDGVVVQISAVKGSPVSTGDVFVVIQ